MIHLIIESPKIIIINNANTANNIFPHIKKKVKSKKNGQEFKYYIVLVFIKCTV